MSQPATPDTLRANYEPLSRITVHDLRQMYAVFSPYYANTSWEIFLRDLSGKTGAFLIRRQSDQRIVGFSTVLTKDMVVHGKQARAVFSGDTIIEREYWGSRVLVRAFYQFLITEKLRHPRQTLYWLLISKGFKTYLLLANNFFNFYPRVGQHDERLAAVVDLYCREMFADYYQPERGILDFGPDYQHLKEDVAEITDAMRMRFPAIRFFEECNPEWRRGTELPCVGAIDWSDLARFSLRYLNKQRSRGRAEAEQSGSEILPSAPVVAPVRARVINALDRWSTVRVSERLRRIA